MRYEAIGWPARASARTMEYCEEDGPWGMLAAAIVVQAAMDYMCALSRVVNRDSDVWVKDRMMRDVEGFMRSRWFSRLTGLDGEYLLQRMQREVQEEAKHDKR